ncbi:MAG: sugar transferase [Bdellovibrionales bacterium]
MLKRIFDIVFSLFGLIILTPIFILVAVFIVLESRGGVFYRQLRIGQYQKGFRLLKFRTMHQRTTQGLSITIGNNDARITKIGKVLRKYKLDELPQLWNVLIGEMSFVGPRPEVPRYVEMYNAEQLEVLSVKPGITDYASIKYRNENELLAKAENPEQFYIEEVMPSKLRLNMFYVKNQSFLLDIKLIVKTLVFIFVRS